MDLSIILPIHNESQNIIPLLDEIEFVMRKTALCFEVIAVDDGSTDGSTVLLETQAKNRSYLKVIIFRQNAGQSAAFDAGFRHASGKIVVTMDADGQNDPNDIPKMIDVLNQGYDFVTGWRRVRHDNLLVRRFPSLMANWIIRKVTGSKIHDLGCSLKAYRKEITDELRLYGETHRFISVLVQSLSDRITEVEVNHRPRTKGQSKYGLLRTFKVVLDLATVRFLQAYQTKPIYVFGGFSMLLFAFSALTAVFVLYEKFSLGIWVHKNPLFNLAGLSGIIGVQFLGLGLLSELMMRTYYESQAKPAYSIKKSLGFNKKTPSTTNPENNISIYVE